MQETPPFSSVSASGHLTVVLGRIWTAQLLAAVVHQAGPSISSTIWQKKGLFSYRCGMAPARAPQVPCGMCSPAWVLTFLCLRAQSAFAFTPKWLSPDGLRVHAIYSPHRNSNSQRKKHRGCTNGKSGACHQACRQGTQPCLEPGELWGISASPRSCEEAHGPSQACWLRACS